MESMLVNLAVALVAAAVFLVGYIHGRGKLKLSRQTKAFKRLKSAPKTKVRLRPKATIGALQGGILWLLALRPKLSVRGLLYGAFYAFMAAVIGLAAVAFMGLPQLYEDQFIFDRDAEVVREEVRLARIDAPKDGSLQTGLQERDVVKTTGTEGIRSASHFDELLVHFEGRRVRVEVTRDDDMPASSWLTPDQTLHLEAVNITEHKYSTSAPYVGLVTTAQLVAGTLAEGSYTNSPIEHSNQTLRAYSSTSMQSLGVRLALFGLYTFALSVLLAVIISTYRLLRAAPTLLTKP